MRSEEKSSETRCLTILSEINCYEPKDCPARPAELDAFAGLSPAERERTSIEFHRQPHIKDYLDEKWMAELYNRDTFIRLHELFCDATKPTDKHALCQKLLQFKAKIQATIKPYRALILDFTKYPFSEEVLNQRADWDD